MEKIKEYLQNAIDSFVGDPSDTDYQDGYLEALLDVKEFIFGKEKLGEL